MSTVFNVSKHYNGCSSAAALYADVCFGFSQVHVGSAWPLQRDPVPSQVFIHFSHGAGGDSDLVWEGHEPRSEPPTQSADRRARRWVKPCCISEDTVSLSRMAVNKQRHCQTTAAYTHKRHVYSSPPPLFKFTLKVMTSVQDLSCLVWNFCLHWLDFRLRNWVHTRSESSSIPTAWTIWRPLLPWCALSDRWMLLLHWGSCYHTITVVTSVSWCHPHQKWLSDKPPSSSLSMRWFLVGLLSAI